MKCCKQSDKVIEPSPRCWRRFEDLRKDAYFTSLNHCRTHSFVLIAPTMDKERSMNDSCFVLVWQQVLQVRLDCVLPWKAFTATKSTIIRPENERRANTSPMVTTGFLKYIEKGCNVTVGTSTRCFFGVCRSSYFPICWSCDCSLASNIAGRAWCSLLCAWSPPRRAIRNSCASCWQYIKSKYEIEIRRDSARPPGRIRPCSLRSSKQHTAIYWELKLANSMTSICS